MEYKLSQTETREAVKLVLIHHNAKNFHDEKTRELCNWLVSEYGWRKEYTGNNLFVFDFYSVLTSENNHHIFSEGKEMRIINDNSNTLYDDSDGDDHHNDEGNRKRGRRICAAAQLLV